MKKVLGDASMQQHERKGQAQELKPQGGRRREPSLWVSITIQPRKPQEAAELENNTGWTNLPFKNKTRRGVFSNLFNISFHQISYLNQHLVPVYYFSVLINMF